jgi:dihydrofolate reductase
MPRIIVTEFLTLDGVMQAPGQPDEDRDGGFDHGGWQIDYFDDVFGEFVTEGMKTSGGLLLGRRTYEIFARHWPFQPEDDPIAGMLTAMPKHVVSTTLSEPLPWANSHLIEGDVPAAIARLKEGDGKDLHVIGSGGLVQTLVRHGLVDLYELMIHPLVLGTGKRLFREELGSPLRLRLVESKPTTKGVLLLTYAPETAEGDAGPQDAVGAGTATAGAATAPVSRR